MRIPYQGAHKLDDLIFALNKPLIGKKGAHYQKLLKDWRLIVGDDMARITVPTKISTSKQQNSLKNVLYIAASNAATLAELVYHTGVIIEQINFYFGYEYIEKLKFIQAVFKVEPSIDEVSLELSSAQEQKLGAMMDEYVAEDEIKAILRNLAINILKRN
jgi:hypothetical protein